MPNAHPPQTALGFMSSGRLATAELVSYRLEGQGAHKLKKSGVSEKGSAVYLSSSSCSLRARNDCAPSCSEPHTPLPETVHFEVLGSKTY